MTTDRDIKDLQEAGFTFEEIQSIIEGIADVDAGRTLPAEEVYRMLDIIMETKILQNV